MFLFTKIRFMLLLIPLSHYWTSYVPVELIKLPYKLFFDF